jgi:hypothetical protein
MLFARRLKNRAGKLGVNCAREAPSHSSML